MNDQTEDILDIGEAKKRIALQLKKIASGNFPNNLHPVLQFKTKIQYRDPLKWLDAQEDNTRFYFCGRNVRDFETAGVGVADAIYAPETPDYQSAFAHMRKYLVPEYPELKYYGGFSFAPGHIDADWKPFGACHFFIPRFQLLLKENDAFLVCNVITHKETPASIEKIIIQLEQMNFTGPRDFPKPGKPISRTDYPNHDRWLETLTRVIAEIKNGQYKKTVLARKVELLFENPPDPVAILASLKQTSSRRYDFLFQFDAKTAFLGSSPEQLYQRNGRNLESEAIAGTRSRGKNQQEDTALAEELMNSNKDQREHDFVIHTIEQELRPFCSSLDVESNKSLLILKEGMHLISHIKGTLKSSVTDEMLISILHPTPAVGGCPREKALAVIRESEPFKRGWYAGVIGSVGHGSVDFAVGLRSALVKNNLLALYSGVGIVEGSIPEDEWKEVDDKILNFMNIINPLPFIPVITVTGNRVVEKTEP
ncbi:MAG TPA: isochorismate synthase [Candidatus Deferrimicrobium sp.]|nr:isochorismate synthase [Candidatus Deferrimicrobium sp.]